MSVRELERQIAETIRAYEIGVGMPPVQRKTDLDASGRIVLKGGADPFGELPWAVKGADRLRYAYEVDQVSLGEYAPIEIVNMGPTPETLVAGGMRELPLVYRQRHLIDAIHEEDGTSTHYHGLTVEQIKRLPELLEHPAAVCDSPRRNDVAVALLAAVDGNKDPLIVAIQPNTYATYAGREIECNMVLSVYGKRNATRYFHEKVGESRIAFLSEGKERELEALAGLRLPRCHQRARTDIIRRLACVDNHPPSNAKPRASKHLVPDVVFSAEAESLGGGFGWRIDSSGRGWLEDRLKGAKRFQFDVADGVDAMWFDIAERIAAIDNGYAPPAEDVAGAVMSLETAPELGARCGSFLKSKSKRGTRFIAPVGNMKLSVTAFTPTGTPSRTSGCQMTWKLATGGNETVKAGTLDGNLQLSAALAVIASDLGELPEERAYPPVESLKGELRNRDAAVVENDSMTVSASCADGNTWAVESSLKDGSWEPVVTYGESLEGAFESNIAARNESSGVHWTCGEMHADTEETGNLETAERPETERVSVPSMQPKRRNAR